MHLSGGGGLYLNEFSINIDWVQIGIKLRTKRYIPKVNKFYVYRERISVLTGLKVASMDVTCKCVFYKP